MAIIFLLLGLLIGSFLNVCIYRIPVGKSVVFPPSSCLNCNHKIKWYENIPVISYIFILKGRCSSCKEKISLQYPLVELITGLLFCFFYKKVGYNLELLKYILFISLLIVGVFVDLKEYYIPDRITLALIGLGLVSSFFTVGFERSLVGGSTFMLFFVILYGFGEHFGKEIMGFGDVKLALGIGTIVGYKGLYNVFIFLNISFISGALIGVILILLKVKTRKDTIPFGPYIALSGLVIAYIS